MRFLADQDVYAATVERLRDGGHDVETVARLGLAISSDEDILRTAHTDGRVLLTRDRDYGNLVFVQALRAGVIYLRMLPSTMAAVHDELDNLLEKHAEQELRASFVVVEPARHRMRRMPTA